MPEQVPMAEQISCVEREIRMRRRAYPRWITAGKMSAQDAEREIRRMEAVLETLHSVAGIREDAQPDLLSV